MSSRKYKAARRQAALSGACAPAEADLPADPTVRRRLVSSRQKQRAQEHHQEQMVHLRDTRRATTLPLDWLDDANDEPHWEGVKMHEREARDAIGAPPLTEKMLHYLSRGEKDTYRLAVRRLAREQPKQGRAYTAVFHGEEQSLRVTRESEDAAAREAGVSVPTFRAQLWAGVRAILTATHGHVPARVAAYATEHKAAISRHARRRRARARATPP